MHIGDKYKVYQREANDSLHDTPRGEKGENTLMKESLPEIFTRVKIFTDFCRPTRTKHHTIFSKSQYLDYMFYNSDISTVAY